MPDVIESTTVSTSFPEPISRIRLVVAASIAVVATVAVLQASSGGSAAAPSQAPAAPMLQVAPGGAVELASLPADHQDLYRAAADDPEAFEAVPCYCGCEAFLDHRHLGDCFVRPDGGWERHATGCGICLAQARDMADMRTDQVPLDQIVRDIDDRYGATTAPSA